MNNWISTYTGGKFYYDDIAASDIDINDIAHALSMIPRFSGHVSAFYSVAQHCVLGARRTMAPFKLEFLLHDASEAYVADVPRPLKEQVQEYCDIEHFIQREIAKRFKVGFPFNSHVHAMDQRMLATEARDLLHPNCDWWKKMPVRPFSETIEPWEQDVAEQEYLKLFNKLTGALPLTTNVITHEYVPRDASPSSAAKEPAIGLPDDPDARKGIPVGTGVLDYFPDALCEVAKASMAGNRQHHDGTPLHWDRSKSSDESDAMIRHYIDRGKVDKDGVRHSGKMAWRALAYLQKEIEQEKLK